MNQLIAPTPKPQFQVLLLDGARKFINSLEVDVQSEIYSDMRAASITKDSNLFKKISPTIWEFRTKYKNLQYRTLAFWDKTQKAMVMATSGFIKKTQKTPPQEIKKAEQIMKQYYKNAK